MIPSSSAAVAATRQQNGSLTEQCHSFWETRGDLRVLFALSVAHAWSVWSNDIKLALNTTRPSVEAALDGTNNPGGRPTAPDCKTHHRSGCPLSRTPAQHMSEPSQHAVHNAHCTPTPLPCSGAGAQRVISHAGHHTARGGCRGVHWPGGYLDEVGRAGT